MNASIFNPPPLADVRGLERLQAFGEGADDDARHGTEPFHPFWDRRTTLADLIASQGTRPIQRIEDLKADFWPADEEADQIVQAIRRWRGEGGWIEE